MPYFHNGVADFPSLYGLSIFICPIRKKWNIYYIMNNFEIIGSDMIWRFYEILRHYSGYSCFITRIAIMLHIAKMQVKYVISMRCLSLPPHSPLNLFSSAVYAERHYKYNIWASWLQTWKKYWTVESMMKCYLFPAMSMICNAMFKIKWHTVYQLTTIIHIIWRWTRNAKKK